MPDFRRDSALGLNLRTAAAIRPYQGFSVGAYRRDARLSARQRPRIKSTDASAMRPYPVFSGRGISPRWPTFRCGSALGLNRRTARRSVPTQCFPVGAYRRDARLLARQRLPINLRTARQNQRESAINYRVSRMFGREATVAQRRSRPYPMIFFQKYRFVIKSFLK